MKDSDKRIKLITGHFGSGKTEFSINYAVFLKKLYSKVAVVDLDIINTYFRVREKMDFLESLGIESFSSSLAKGNSLDLPALDPAILKPLENKEYKVVVDMGGNPKGALPLGRYRDVLDPNDYDNYFVINRNRPETSTVSGVVDFIHDTESYSQTRVTGLINTTHMLKNTTKEDLLFGQELVEEVSQKLNLPIIYIAAKSSVAEELMEIDSIKDKVFPLELYFRDNWMV